MAGSGFGTRAAMVIAVGATLFGLLVLAAPAAWAHDELVSANPAQGAVLAAAPDNVVLTFSDELDQATTRVALTKSGQPVAGSTTAQVIGNQVIQAVPKGAGPGSYSVAYRVVSTDGHPVSGTLSFSVSDPVSASSAPPSVDRSAAATDSPAPAATQSQAAVESAGAERGGSSDSRWLVALTVGIAIIVLGAVAIVGLRRARRPGPPI